MTRKDYVMIAEVFADAASEVNRKPGVDPSEVVELLATYIADGLVQDNPRFDRARFMAACGFKNA